MSTVSMHMLKFTDIHVHVCMFISICVTLFLNQNVKERAPVFNMNPTAGFKPSPDCRQSQSYKLQFTQSRVPLEIQQTVSGSLYSLDRKLSINTGLKESGPNCL